MLPGAAGITSRNDPRQGAMRPPLLRDPLTGEIAPPDARPSGTRTPAYRRMLALLRSAREEAGLTQAEVARHFERRQSFVSKCETGERRIDPTELRKFAELYHRPLTYFIDDGS